jgi:hypothetical protein
MYDAIKHLLNMPVPMWFFALCAGLFWLEHKRSRRWIDREDMKRLRESLHAKKSTGLE